MLKSPLDIKYFLEFKTDSDYIINTMPVNGVMDFTIIETNLLCIINKTYDEINYIFNEVYVNIALQNVEYIKTLEQLIINLYHTLTMNIYNEIKSDITIDLFVEHFNRFNETRKIIYKLFRKINMAVSTKNENSYLNMLGNYIFYKNIIENTYDGDNIYTAVLNEVSLSKISNENLIKFFQILNNFNGFIYDSVDKLVLNNYYNSTIIDTIEHIPTYILSDLIKFLNENYYKYTCISFNKFLIKVCMKINKAYFMERHEKDFVERLNSSSINLNKLYFQKKYLYLYENSQKYISCIDNIINYSLKLNHDNISYIVFPPNFLPILNEKSHELLNYNIVNTNLMIHYDKSICKMTINTTYIKAFLIDYIIIEYLIKNKEINKNDFTDYHFILSRFDKMENKNIITESDNNIKINKNLSDYTYIDLTC